MEDIVFAWCYMVFDKPDGKGPEECVTHFKNEIKLAFTPLSYWGYHDKEQCQVLMCYSMQADNPEKANESLYESFKQLARDSPNSSPVAFGFCGDQDQSVQASWVREIMCVITEGSKEPLEYGNNPSELSGDAPDIAYATYGNGNPPREEWKTALREFEDSLKSNTGSTK